LYWADLQNIFEEIWILVRKYKFTPEYVEELPPVERQLFLNFGREEEEAKLQAAAKSDGKMFNLGDAEDFDDFDFG